MKYMLLLYKYISIYPVRVMKCLKKYVEYLDAEDIKVCEISIDDFKRTEYMQNLADKTREFYLVDVRKFTDWLKEYKHCSKERVTHPTQVNRGLIQTNTHNTGTQELDEEYKSFLQRYEELTT